MKEESIQFLSALLASNSARALGLAQELMARGMSYESLCIEVIQPALHEVGRMWQTVRASVAQEHVATAITQNVLAQVFEPKVAATDPPRRMVACAPEGEHHGIGLRIISDFAVRSGWEVLYLGTSVPHRDLVSFVEEHQPDVVAVTTSVPMTLPSTRECFRALASLHTRPLLVGGGNAFGGRAQAAHSVGADVFAADARAFMEVLDARFG